jgi:hypothetical protein
MVTNELISFLQSKQKKSFLKPKQIVSLYGQRGGHRMEVEAASSENKKALICTSGR